MGTPQSQEKSSISSSPESEGSRLSALRHTRFGSESVCNFSVQVQVRDDARAWQDSCFCLLRVQDSAHQVVCAFEMPRHSMGDCVCSRATDLSRDGRQRFVIFALWPELHQDPCGGAVFEDSSLLWRASRATKQCSADSVPLQYKF